MEHRLYCPACDEVVSIPYATEIVERHCPKCDAPAPTLWPSKAMYERDKPKEVPEVSIDTPVAEEIPVKAKKKGRWL